MILRADLAMYLAKRQQSNQSRMHVDCSNATWHMLRNVGWVLSVSNFPKGKRKIAYHTKN